jgi:hypothetical protein
MVARIDGYLFRRPADDAEELPLQLPADAMDSAGEDLAAVRLKLNCDSLQETGALPRVERRRELRRQAPTVAAMGED